MEPVLGWYYSGFIARQMDIPEREIRRIVLESMPSFEIEVASGKPLVISEFGAGAKQGHHGEPHELWTEEYQARVYRQQLAMMANATTWRGLTPWILKDFRTPLRLLPGIQDGFNRKGVVSETGEKKQAFYVLRDFYREHDTPLTQVMRDLDLLSQQVRKSEHNLTGFSRKRYGFTGVYVTEQLTFL